MAALPTDLIDIRTDARAVDETAVAGLAESIAAVGLINPIRVRANGDRWELIAGAHRLAAHRSLGLAEIECAIVTDDDLHAELAMIDENLCRAELSAVDRARQTARRAAIYLELHPETAEHVAGGVAKNAAENFAAAPSFATDTAAKTGKDERTVRLHAERGKKIIPEVLGMIEGTPLDTGKFMDEIKNYTPNDQFKVAKRELGLVRAKEREKANGMSRRFKPAIDPEDVTDKQFNTLMSAWNNAGADARERFLAAIDNPVMDRNAA